MTIILRIPFDFFGLDKIKAKIISRLGRKAVREAIEENRRLGLPSPFEKDGKVYYKMPDGTVTSENPFK